MIESASSTLLTVEEMASKLRVPVSWIYSRTRIKAEGSIPHVRVGKYLRFRENEVLDWIREQSAQRG